MIESVAHLLVLAGLLTGIKILEKFVHKLWDYDYLFFNRIKLKYIFDGADLVLLVGFLAWGVYLLASAYMRKPE
jgi:hypothetical protein